MARRPARRARPPTRATPRRRSSVAAVAAARRPAWNRRQAEGQPLIGDDDVDAVVVTSSGPTHEELVLAAIEQARGPSALDGCAAAAVAERCLEAFETG